MATPSFNRFNVLNNLTEGNKTSKCTASSPPSKKSKKRRRPALLHLGIKLLVIWRWLLRKTVKNQGIVWIAKSREIKDSAYYPNRRLVLSDSDTDKDVATNELSEPEKELKHDSPVKMDSPVEPTPPEARQNIYPVTKYYVDLARQHHTIPTLGQLLDRAGAFGRMFENGKPVNCLASDIINLNEIYGMYRERFQERKVMWEEKASIIFFEQGFIQQEFEKGKIILFFDLIKKHRDRVPSLFRLYNAVYDLDGMTEAE